MSADDLSGWIFWLALPALVAACISDVRWRLVPDWASLMLFVLGLVAASISANPGFALLGGLVGTAFGAIAARFGFWGWGDAKLFAGAVMIAGPASAMPLVWGMAITGALLALTSYAMRPAARRYATASGASLPRWMKNELRRCRLAPSIPYAVAIAGGVVCSSVF